MKLKLLFLLFLASASSFAQYTLIPDVKFENKLISLGIDFGTPDGKVLTSKINTLTSLNVRSSSIADLTGIQGFTSLKSLLCDTNQLTALDVSKNTALTYLSFGDNYLTAIDVSKNTALTELRCYHNLLTTLDVSKNTAIVTLYCYENQLKALDVSKNIALTYFNCSDNQLSVLNLKNGNNSKLSTNSLFYGNNLSCIQVDNVAYANANWASAKDASASYSLDCSAVVQYTLIPDVNFEKKLISLGIDSGTADGKVLTANVSSRTSLDVSSSSITDLTGIQDFTALTDLNCSYNQLTSLVLSKNTALKILFCHANKLTALDVSTNIALTDLRCFSNQLKTFDISKNTALTYFFCGANQLSVLDVSKNTALTNLQCGSNQLVSLDVSKNTALTNLYCYSNKFATLDISKNTALTIFHCYSNQLKNLDVSKNIALTDLKCYSNQLKNLDVSKNIALTDLRCFSNQLMSLDASTNTALTILNCYSNQLVSLNIKNGKNTSLSTRDFTNNPNLSCIQVDDLAYSNTNWTSAKDATASYSNNCPAAVVVISNEFENKLIALGIDTDGKNGSVLLASITNVKSLDVSNSGISDLKGIECFNALETLNCNSNKLATLDVSKNTTLTSLSCDSNKFTTLDVSSNTALKTLNCSSNSLKNLNVSYNIGLMSLDCSKNQLTSLDVSKNTALTTLNCNSNKLVYLDIKNGKNGSLNYFDCLNNPDLSCILAEAAIPPGANNWKKDAAATYSASACYTYIPDSNFELALSYYDDIPNDHQVPTAKIVSLTSLNVKESSITDLTGIKDFPVLADLNCIGNQLTSLDVSKNVQLTSLACQYNKLTSLDITKNVNLIYLYCDSNQLTALDVTKNVNLYYLYFNYNKLTTIDVSKNVGLSRLVCISNQLTSLDISKNVKLGLLACQNNSLTSLNLKNGKNNVNMSDRTLSDFRNNPNLSCIQVDNVAYSNANWAAIKDATASYSNNCPAPAPVVIVNNEFENKLIALGVDTDGKNGSVLLASITNVTSLDVSNSGITSLSGIEYFSKLETLICKGNSLTTINVSQNPALKYLDCSKNPLSALDVSKNTQLSELYCDGIVTITKKINAKTSVANQLTVLDVSKNLSLTKLSCFNNQIVSLDLSKNTLLTDVNCSNNKLTSLNLTNGNNSKLANVNFKTNASLSCILVDDVAYANANWASAKDATASYSKTACTLGIAKSVFDTIAVYPNPTKGEIHIDNCVVEKARVYDALGKLITTKTFTEGSNNNTINLAGFLRGIYYIYLESAGATSVKKIVVE